MGSASLLDSSDSASGGTKKNKGKPKALVSKANKEQMTNAKERKRNASQKNEEHAGSKKRPKRAAACTDFKERSVQVSDKSSLLESRRDQFAEEEIIAIHLTQGQDDGRPNRRLTDFVVHDENGTPQPLEMIEVNDMFISGLVLPLDETSDKEKEKRVRCEGFGRIEGWDISGYEDGTPVVWLTTDIADYDCLKPAGNYKKFYDHFFEKARACVEVYKKLSKSSGGNPDLSVDELLAGVVRSLRGSKYFCGAAPVKDFVISQGEFIYKQLVGLDETSKKNDQKFMELPALIALKEKSERHGNFVLAKAASTTGSLTIHQASGDTVSNVKQSISSTAAEEDEDAKLARLLQEEEYWQNAKKQKKIHGSASSPNTVYIKIYEYEIANDYPLLAFYNNFKEQIDEYMSIDTKDHVMVDLDELPTRMLHNWSLYNFDSRLISLELLPMKPCIDIEVNIFGSGKMIEDDGSGFYVDD